MTESVFETVEKCCQVLKLDFSSASLPLWPGTGIIPGTAPGPGCGHR